MGSENEYDLSAVRDLLRACYDAETLPRFLLYCGDARLQALREEFAPGDGMTAMVEKVIVHTGRQALLGELLARVAEDNPDQYARFASRLPAVVRGVYVPATVPDLDVLPEPGPLPPGSRMPFARNAIFTGREEALKAYTYNGAYAAFEERTRGSITPGKLADIIVLSADITKVPEEEIQKQDVLYTIVGGKVVYKK